MFRVAQASPQSRSGSRWAGVAPAVALRLTLLAAAIQMLRPLENPIGDVSYYYELARLSSAGRYPFLDFWMEYPPVFPALLVGIYQLLDLFQRADAASFSLAYIGLMSGVDVVNLLLVHRLVSSAYGEREARVAALLYAVTPFLIWFTLGWFDALAVCFFLAGLLALQSRRPVTAGVLTAIGGLTKLFPLGLLLAVPFLLRERSALKMAAAVAITAGAVLCPLLLTRPDMLGASFASMATRQPWETVWALAEDRFSWGKVVPLSARVTSASALAQVGSSSGLVSLGVLLALGLVVLAGAVLLLRRGVLTPRDAYLLLALAVCSLLLGSKGFSPQFIVWLVPLLLLVWPNRIGGLYLLAWTGYLAFYYVGFLPNLYDYVRAGTAPPPDVAQLAWISVLVRTAMLGWTTAHLARLIVLRSSSAPSTRPSFLTKPAWEAAQQQG